MSHTHSVGHGACLDTWIQRAFAFHWPLIMECNHPDLNRDPLSHTHKKSLPTARNRIRDRRFDSFGKQERKMNISFEWNSNGMENSHWFKSEIDLLSLSNRIWLESCFPLTSGSFPRGFIHFIFIEQDQFNFFWDAFPFAQMLSGREKNDLFIL